MIDNHAMAWLALKVLASALLIVAISEIARRSSLLAALLASLPLTSLLAMVWMHVDGASTQAIGEFSRGVAWLVLPSLILFIALPVLMRHGLGFWTSLGLSCAATAAGDLVILAWLRRFGAGA